MSILALLIFDDLHIQDRDLLFGQIGGDAVSSELWPMFYVLSLYANVQTTPASVSRKQQKILA